MEQYREYSESSSKEVLQGTRITKYEQILDNIKQDKYNYEDLYEELINEAYKSNDLDTIRSAHELFADMFPLAPSVWLKLIRFEITLMNFRDNVHVENIMRKFDRALNDYYSGEIAEEYARFLNEVEADVPDVVWERLMDSYGPSFQHGERIFDFSRAYYFGNISIPSTTLPTKIINTYIKQLEMPLDNIDRTYEDLKEYYMKNQENAPSINWEDISSTYQTTKKNLDLIVPFEMKLETNPDYNLYREYLSEVENKIPENWYQCIYEQATSDLCLNADIWIQYVNYIRKRDKNKSAHMENLQACTLYRKNAMDIINQAIRNCFLEPKLYVLQMNIAEENSLIYPAGRIKTILENAIEALGATHSSLLLLWLEYLSYLQRNTKFDNRDEFGVFEEECEEAVDMCYPDDNTILDPLYEIYRLWGTIEYTFGDLEQARYLWEKVANEVKGINQAAMWTQYANLEIQFGNIGEARNVFMRGAKAILSQPFDVQDTLSDQFETFDTFDRNHRSITESEQIAHGSKEDASSFLYKDAEIIELSIHLREAEEFADEVMNRLTRNQSVEESTNSNPQISKRRRLEIDSIEDNAIVPQHQHTEVDTTEDSIFVVNYKPPREDTTSPNVEMPGTSEMSMRTRTG